MLKSINLHIADFYAQNLPKKAVRHTKLTLTLKIWLLNMHFGLLLVCCFKRSWVMVGWNWVLFEFCLLIICPYVHHWFCGSDMLSLIMKSLCIAKISIQSWSQDILYRIEEFLLLYWVKYYSFIAPTSQPRSFHPD